MQGRCNPLGFG